MQPATPPQPKAGAGLSGGSAVAAQRNVICATMVFTEAVIGAGMEFSPTKNVCLASKDALARRVVAALPHLAVKVVVRTKSLGSALQAGRRRNARVQPRARLSAFKVRKDRLRKVRRAVGAKRTSHLLAAGGTAALVYGQANTGVSDTTLLAQRRAVAAASVPEGAGELDITLVLADGADTGRVDPAFAAHEDPIGMWAEAVWCQWLPRAALRSLATHAGQVVGAAARVWSKVHGPATAAVASARRLGWTVLDEARFRTDLGVVLDLDVDSPAFVVREVGQAVRRWRWRRIEDQHPTLKQGEGGHGAFFAPVRRLLAAGDRPGRVAG